MNPSVFPLAMGKYYDQLSSFLSYSNQSKKRKTEFKPALSQLKIGLESHPAYDRRVR